MERNVKEKNTANSEPEEHAPTARVPLDNPAEENPNRKKRA